MPTPALLHLLDIQRPLRKLTQSPCLHRNSTDCSCKPQKSYLRYSKRFLWRLCFFNCCFDSKVKKDEHLDKKRYKESTQRFFISLLPVQELLRPFLNKRDKLIYIKGNHINKSQSRMITKHKSTKERTISQKTFTNFEYVMILPLNSRENGGRMGGS